VVSGFTRSVCFYCCIQGKNVGLKCDLIDGFEDFPNISTGGFERSHRRTHQALAPKE